VKRLKVGIPKGSLENRTIELFRKSGWKIGISDRSYFPSIDDEETQCTLVRAQEMSRFVEMGTLDVGLTGRDWILENASDVVVVRDDAIVEVTETGSTIRANGLRIVGELLETHPQLIANKQSWQDPWKREKAEQISLLLQGALRAETMVGLKMNCSKDDLEKVVEILPSITAPTISNLYQSDWFAVETIISEEIVRDIIPKLQKKGAVGIIEYPLNKVI